MRLQTIQMRRELLRHPTWLPVHVGECRRDPQMGHLFVSSKHHLLPHRRHTTGLINPSMDRQLFAIPVSGKKSGFGFYQDQLPPLLLHLIEAETTFAQILNSRRLNIGEVDSVIYMVKRIEFVETNFQQSGVNVSICWDFQAVSLSAEHRNPTLPSPS